MSNRRKSWNHLMIMLTAVTAITMATVTLWGHTPAESNELVRAMLYAATPRGCDGGRAGMSRQQWAVVLKSHLPDVFFGSICTNSGWSYEGRVAAFDNFIANMGGIDFLDESNEYRQCAVMAVNQCRDMNYAKATVPIRQLVYNPSYPSYLRSRAIEAAVHLGGLDDDSTAFVDSIMTNTSVFSRSERSMASKTYAAIVQGFVVTNEAGAQASSNALSMIYRNRFVDWENAYHIDDMLVARINGYALSSNRLELAEHVLAVTNCWNATRIHFVSITNQLLSSGQPLVQLNIGEGE